jgi:hypothetical protein
MLGRSVDKVRHNARCVISADEGAMVDNQLSNDADIHNDIFALPHSRM